MTVPAHLLRPAVGNALWRPLRLEAWLTDYASNSPRPLPPGQLRSTTPAPKSPEARWEPVNGRLLGHASRADSRINAGFTAELRREDHDALLKLIQWGPKRQWEEALNLSTCERPFYRDEDQPTGWRRNYKDETITEDVAKVLLLLAGLCIVTFAASDEAVDAALIGA